MSDLPGVHPGELRPSMLAVTLQYVQTLDGRIATRTGQPQWISIANGRFRHLGDDVLIEGDLWRNGVHLCADEGLA